LRRSLPLEDGEIDYGRDWNAIWMRLTPAIGGDRTVIDPTYDEIDFIRMLAARGGELSLGGSIRLLKINRLIPEYVTRVSASMHKVVFTLTEGGWQLAQTIDSTR
jgi:hypothetical protein